MNYHSQQPALLEARAQIISLIAARGHEDRYAALLSRCRSTEAVDLIRQVFGELAHWQRATGKRVRKFRAKSGQTYHVAIETLAMLEGLQEPARVRQVLDGSRLLPVPQGPPS